ncbi:MAG: RagB/SusD family nutrient uptake outer membrane protein [Sulfuricurvum sp.]|nr:RagB/SusD family nutrient uptake outer membrane protein [Sulfuricurvum sp.]
MKKFFYLILISILLGVTSCNYMKYDFYDGPVTEAQFWKLNNSARGELNQAYSFLQQGYNSYDGAMLAAGCDEAVNSNLNSTVNIFNNGTWSSLRTMNDLYAYYYRGIRQVNVFLTHANTANIIPATDIPRLRGEAFFLRAYFHFELLKRYGGVIIAKRVYNPNDTIDLPRNTFSETVGQIVMDCDSALAIPTLPLAIANSASSDFGRATKAAAMALKSRTLLYGASPLNNPSNDLTLWQKAADAAKMLIDSKAHSLLANYADVFNYSVAAFNSEVIFATSADNRNDIETNNAPISFAGALGRTNPTQELVDAYEMKNGLLISDPLSGYSASNPYLNRDPRLTLSIFYNGSKYKSTTIDTYVDGKDSKEININGTKTGYYMAKFLSSSATWNQATNTLVRRPWVIFRYAEILLNYAEAQNEAVGPDQSVYDAVNQIRKRARSGIATDLPANLTKDEMRERIRNERRVELAFEEHRFYDVRRWKIGEQTFGKPVTGMKIVNSGTNFTYEPYTVETRVFEAKDYRFPIPQSEIDKTTKLVQNSGW